MLAGRVAKVFLSSCPARSIPGSGRTLAVRGAAGQQLRVVLHSLNEAQVHRHLKSLLRIEEGLTHLGSHLDEARPQVRHHGHHRELGAHGGEEGLVGIGQFTGGSVLDQGGVGRE